MATVKLTGGLESDIKNMVEKAYRARLEKLNAEMKESVSPEQILQIYIENTGGNELYEKVKHWIPRRRGIDQYYYGGIGLHSLNMGFTTGDTPVPHGLSDAMHEGAAYFEPIFAKFKGLRKTHEDLNTEARTTTTQILTAFRSYPSVNAAVKAHPDLEHMLPDYAKQKMAQKVERNRGGSVDVEVDGAKIKTIATLNKIYAGAN